MKTQMLFISKADDKIFKSKFKTQLVEHSEECLLNVEYVILNEYISDLKSALFKEKQVHCVLHSGAAINHANASSTSANTERSA